MRDCDGLFCCTDSTNCIFPQLSCSIYVKKIRNFLNLVAFSGRCLCLACGSWHCLPSGRLLGHSGTTGIFSPPDMPANSPPPLSIFLSPLLLLPSAGRGFWRLFFRPPPQGSHCLPGMPGGRGRKPCHGEQNVFVETVLPVCLPPAV